MEDGVGAIYQRHAAQARFLTRVTTEWLSPPSFRIEGSMTSA